ncbi:hypothetical protein ANAEL_04599 [Anaerolineales bacterium]|nr:hypothetical protein ANAEL_04599 [Anaerolineales bacterium]
MNLYEWLKANKFAGFKVEPARLQRANDIHSAQPNVESRLNGDTVVETTMHSYVVRWEITPRGDDAVIRPSCTCPDWADRGRYSNLLCKHLLSVAIHSGDLVAATGLNPISADIVFPKEEKQQKAEPLEDFNEHVRREISKAVSSLAENVLAVLKEGYVPFLLGPTGVGKTSAIRQVALATQSLLIEHAGADSFTDSDLVGVEMPSGKRMAGPIGNALSHAREMGEPVLLFLDEFLRYNSRAQESLMRLLLPIPTEITRVMGISHDGAIRATSAPFWGDEWAPAESVSIVLAANPWGNVPDPALVRRTVPIIVGFENNVAGLFSQKTRAAIDLSWKGTADGSLPLPIEYGELARAQSADDPAILSRYNNRLMALDPAAAKGFETLLGNLGAKS